MKPERRAVNGVLLLNKPLDISSNHILQKVKRLFNAKKAGHTGTLDPLATGMLPIVFGEATKYSQYSLSAHKAYLVTMRLGTTTTTGDLDGDIVSHEEVFRVTKAQLLMTISNYIGDVEQIPPMYSALKHQGKPLYKLAREGKTVERKPRQVTIKHIELVSYDDKQAQMLVHCSKGTYIRTLIEDIGKELGCGACVASLHRVFVEPFEQDKMYTIEELEHAAQEGVEALDKLLLPMSSMLCTMPVLMLTDEQAKAVYSAPDMAFSNAQEGNMQLVNESGQFLGVGLFDSVGNLVKRRLVSN